MKKILMLTMVAVCACAFAADKKKDAYDIRPDAAKASEAPAVEKWQADRRAAIDAATTPEALAPYVASAAAAEALCAEVKANYATCPMKATVIAAVSQYVMLPGDAWYTFSWLAFWTQSKSDERKTWVKALIKSAETAATPDVTCFFLDQIRWCGCDCPCLLKRIDAVAAKSADPAVKEMAALVTRELKGQSIGL